MFRYLCFPALTVAMLFTPKSLQAQQSDTSQGFKTQELPPVEVRSLRAGSDAPFAKTELGKKEIGANNLGQDLPFLLQYTPSAVVTSDAGAGVGYTGIRIRGTDGNRINVTLNGIPVNDAESQGAFFVDLPDLASSATSIQVQRGVGTSTNGPGAFGASISISNLDQMEQAGAEAHIGFGSFNTQKYTARAGTGMLQNGVSFDVRLSKISSDGYIRRSASDLSALQFLAGWRASDRTNLRFLFLTGKEKTGQAWNGVAEPLLATDRRSNTLGMKADGNFYDNQTDNYLQNYYQVFLDHRFAPYLSGHVALFLTRGKGYYEEYRLGEDFADYGLPDYIRGTDTLSSVDLIRQLWLDNYHYGSVFSLLYEKGPTQLSFGGGYSRYDGEHYGFVKWAEYNVPADHRWYLLDAGKQDLNIYVKGQQKWKNLVFFGDLQVRNVQYDINGFRKNPTLRPTAGYTFFNPKAGLSWLLHNSNTARSRIYASMALAGKEPNRDDFEASPASLPKPERLYDAEAGVELNRLKWSAAANFYYMYYRDQLVVTGQINDVGAYTRTNVPESFRTGLELTTAYQPLPWLRFQANATVSENKILSFTEYMDDYDDGGQIAVDHGRTDIAFSPRFVSAAGLTVSPLRSLPGGQHLELELLNKYVSRQYLDNTSNEARSIKPYNLTDARIRYTLRFRPFREVTATLALNNIFDRMYESNGYTFSYIYNGSLTTENYYFPQAGRNWLLGLGFKW